MYDARWLWTANSAGHEVQRWWHPRVVLQCSCGGPQTLRWGLSPVVYRKGLQACTNCGVELAAMHVYPELSWEPWHVRGQGRGTAAVGNELRAAVWGLAAGVGDAWGRLLIRYSLYGPSAACMQYECDCTLYLQVATYLSEVPVPQLQSPWPLDQLICRFARASVPLRHP